MFFGGAPIVAIEGLDAGVILAEDDGLGLVLALEDGLALLEAEGASVRHEDDEGGESAIGLTEHAMVLPLSWATWPCDGTRADDVLQLGPEVRVRGGGGACVGVTAFLAAVAQFFTSQGVIGGLVGRAKSSIFFKCEAGDIEALQRAFNQEELVASALGAGECNLFLHGNSSLR